MALIQCPECNQPISDKALKCPKCGFPIQDYLNGKIEGLIHLEVGIDFLQSDASYDVVLYSELANKEALDFYQNHPLHVKAATEVVKPAATSRIVVDYEM